MAKKTTMRLQFTAAAIAILVIVAVAVIFFYNPNRVLPTHQAQYYAGEKVSNFLITKVNPENVTGILYVQYPLAYQNGTTTTIRIGESIGYSCDGTAARLIGINGTSAVFVLNITRSSYGCPI
ncbi:MAG: hypothetical protein KGH77_03165 [Candidatus Micrarchaeota archaeon]|nr:hypothetical protein [Candidatus Micrarchaeota archaeon]MDE1864401.1 hypothetical protein [Candidatus Micrarchaeota archaeon]